MIKKLPKLPSDTTELSVQQIQELQVNLQEAQDTLEAIRLGGVDAVVVTEKNRQQIYTLKSADYTYRVLIESMNQGAITLSKDGTILYSNNKFSSLLKRPLEHIIGENFMSFFKAEDTQVLENLLLRNKKGRQKSPDTIELTLPGENFTVVLISATVLPEVESNAYMGIIITDITDRIRIEKGKDEFISLASHQLRTPATSVKQYLGMLLDGHIGKLNEEQRVFIKTAYDSNEKEINIISSILKTAQIDSDAYILTRSPLNLRVLVESVLRDFEPIIRMRHQQLICTVDPAIDIMADGTELCVALANLVENASKYTPAGKQVRVSATQNSKHTTIQVTDEGVGIAKEDQAKIFEKFTRIDNPLSDTISGSGLGLYWVKKIITMHDGSITINSKLGQGTTFSIKLPL
jgi:PAS domain S-box-containing protein